jgi:hypothetical protein
MAPSVLEGGPDPGIHLRGMTQPLPRVVQIIERLIMSLGGDHRLNSIYGSPPRIAIRSLGRHDPQAGRDRAHAGAPNRGRRAVRRVAPRNGGVEARAPHVVIDGLDPAIRARLPLAKIRGVL